MNHQGTKEIETKRLILRRFVEEDIPAVFKNWTSDDNVTKYLSWLTHTSVDITKSVLEDWIKSYKQNNFYQWAIELKSIKEPI